MQTEAPPSPLQHPLDMELEVCTAVPRSVLQMLALKITIITFKRSKSRITVALAIEALQKLAFIYQEFLASFIPSSQGWAGGGPSLVPITCGAPPCLLPRATFQGRLAACRVRSAGPSARSTGF